MINLNAIRGFFVDYQQQMAIVACGLLLIGMYVYGSIRSNDLFLNHSTAKGKIIECYFKRRSAGNISLKYTFEVNGEIHESFAYATNLSKNTCTEKFVGKTFTVLYEKEDVDNNAMLLSPETFQYFQIPFPDSLKWVLPYYKR